MKKFLIDMFINGDRINRQKFWIYQLISLIILIIAIIIYKYNKPDPDEDQETKGLLILNILIFILIIIYLYIVISSFMRRLKDLNKEPLLVLLILIPIFYPFFLIFCGFFEGSYGPNQYGADPLNPDLIEFGK